MQFGQRNAIVVLLKAHADPNIPNVSGQSAMQLAALNPSSDLLTIVNQFGH